MNYNPDMSAGVAAVADKPIGTDILLVVPTGEDDCPLTVTMGYWDPATERWEGDWRHFCVYDEGGPSHEPTDMAGNDPIAWAFPPEIDPELYALIAPKLAA